MRHVPEVRSRAERSRVDGMELELQHTRPDEAPAATRRWSANVDQGVVAVARGALELRHLIAIAAIIALIALVGSSPQV